MAPLTCPRARGGPAAHVSWAGRLLLLIIIMADAFAAAANHGLSGGHHNNLYPPPPPPPPSGAFNPSSSSSSFTEHSPPILLEHPSDLIVAEQSPVTLTCHAAGHPAPQVTWWRWDIHERRPAQVRTTAEQAGMHRIQLPDGSLFFLRTDETSDAGVYWCTAKNDYGIVRSNNATLEIAYLESSFPSDYILEPSPESGADITSLPTIEGVLGSSVQLPCTPPHGRPQPVVSWKREGETLDLTSPGVNKRMGINADGHLRLRDLKVGDEGSYQCVATNMAGSRESNPIVLRVLTPPYFTHPPTNTSALFGTDVFLACSAGGEPKPQTDWTFQDRPLDPARSEVVPGKGVRLRKVQPKQSGTYVCTATSTVGTAHAKADLFVQVPPLITEPPRMLVTVVPGSRHSLSCTAEGQPDPLLLWMHEEERTFLLPGDRTDTLEVASDQENPSSSRLIVDYSGQNSEMQFVCFAVNAVGSAVARSTLKIESSYTREDETKEIGVGGQERDPLLGSIQIHQVTGISPTSIRVSWRLTEPATDIHVVDGFYILFRMAPSHQQSSAPIVPTSATDATVGFTSITVLHAAATSYVVNRLLPYTKYQFLVIPFQRGSPGRPSALHEAYTAEVRPTHAPSGLAWRQLNTSSVEIRWRALERDRFKGEPLGYRILILQHGQVASNLTVGDWRRTEVIMSNLEPRHVYHVQIAGFNSKGLGPFSNLLEVRPEPSMAMHGAASMAAEGNGMASVGTWLIPLVICVALLAFLCTGLLVYARSGRVHSHTGGFRLKLPSFSSSQPFVSSLKGHSASAAAAAFAKGAPIQKEFHLLSSGSRGDSQHQLSSSTRETSLSNFCQRRRFSSGGGARALDEDESDYAYIDRSTHSITGYLNKPSSSARPAAVDGQRQGLENNNVNLSPYATTAVMARQVQGRAGVKGDQRFIQSELFQPLSVNSYLQYSEVPQIAPSHIHHYHASSDHIYALVATPESQARSHSRLQQLPGAKNRISLSSAASLPLEETDMGPNLLDLIPPPPMYPPPNLNLKRSTQAEVLESEDAVIDLTTPIEPTEMTSLVQQQASDNIDVNELYSKVDQSTKRKKLPFTGTPTPTPKITPSHSANLTNPRVKRRPARKSINGRSSAEPAIGGDTGWKSNDDADSSSSESDVEGALVQGKNVARPDIVQHCNGTLPLPSDKKRRDKSLPRRKTRGQRNQQRKRSLTAQPLLNGNSSSGNPSKIGSGSAETSGLLFLPASHLQPDSDTFTENVLMSSTQAVKQAMIEQQQQH